MEKNSMGEVMIRELVSQENPEEFDLLFPAYLAIGNDPENLRYLSFTQKPFEEDTVGFWLSNHLDHGGHYYAAMESRSRISGVLVIRINPIEGFEIYGIGVRPDAKGRGVGTALLQHATGIAAAQGFKAIDALVFADNVPMLRLLLSLSYIPVRIDPHRRSDGADLVALKRYL
jgi:ribosomal protein S18 acetylase RimI-like enzyme